MKVPLHKIFFLSVVFMISSHAGFPAQGRGEIDSRMMQDLEMQQRIREMKKKQQDQLLSRLQDSAPQLYGFEKKLSDLRWRIEEVSQAYQWDEMDRATAEEQLKALIKEQLIIEESLDYKVAQRLQRYLRKMGPPEPPPQQ